MNRSIDYPEFDEDYPDENFEPSDELYAKDIENIQDPELKDKEIEAAGKIEKQEQDLDAKLDSGEISHHEHWSEYEFDIRPQKTRLATRTAIESQGLTYDMLGDITEDWDMLIADNQKLMDQKETLKNTVTRLGPKAAQELADEMLDKGKLSRKTHQMISRQTRLNKK